MRPLFSRFWVSKRPIYSKGTFLPQRCRKNMGVSFSSKSIDLGTGSANRVHYAIDGSGGPSYTNQTVLMPTRPTRRCIKWLEHMIAKMAVVRLLRRSRRMHLCPARVPRKKSPWENPGRM